MTADGHLPLGNSPSPPPTANMSMGYQFCLKAMRQSRNRQGSPGGMIPDFYLPVDGQRHNVDFVYRDEIATFESGPRKGENIKLNGTKARFCEL